MTELVHADRVGRVLTDPGVAVVEAIAMAEQICANPLRSIARHEGVTAFFEKRPPRWTAT